MLRTWPAYPTGSCEYAGNDDAGRAGHAWSGNGGELEWTPLPREYWQCPAGKESDG